MIYILLALRIIYLSNDSSFLPRLVVTLFEISLNFDFSLITATTVCDLLSDNGLSGSSITLYWLIHKKILFIAHLAKAKVGEVKTGHQIVRNISKAQSSMLCEFMVEGGRHSLRQNKTDWELVLTGWNE